MSGAHACRSSLDAFTKSPQNEVEVARAAARAPAVRASAPGTSACMCLSCVVVGGEEGGIRNWNTCDDNKKGFSRQFHFIFITIKKIRA